ncbi:MAG: type II toxin-antitoxin system HicB family antitoxin [Spirochaetes bacterium]|nr:type II toxin-antitoxin system HicB family antitoxin [Spirochaetota bacterium]
MSRWNLVFNYQYTIGKEDKYYVAQCLNVDISRFGETIDESINNLLEAVELYFENNDNPEYAIVENVMIGESVLNV